MTGCHEVIAGHEAEGRKTEKAMLILNSGGLSLPKHWRLMFGLKTCDFPAKNASSSKATANHTKRGRRVCVMCVRVCVCTLTSNVLVRLKKVHGVYNRNIRGETAESIISDITTLTYQMTICTSKASELLQVAAREAWAHACMYFWVSASEHLVQTGTVPNLRRRGECLNSQWKEVGREWRGKTGERQKGRMAARSVWDNGGRKLFCTFTGSEFKKLATSRADLGLIGRQKLPPTLEGSLLSPCVCKFCYADLSGVWRKNTKSPTTTTTAVTGWRSCSVSAYLHLLCRISSNLYSRHRQADRHQPSKNASRIHQMLKK